MTDLHWLSAAQLGRAYQNGTSSPVEVVQTCLDRIDAYNPRLQAFLTVDGQYALDAAHVAEQEIRAGRRRSALHGIPIGIKDIIDVSGQVTTCHSRLMLDNLAQQDATVVHKLRAAGAIILGKLALHEFAIGGPGPDSVFPAARNPWATAHHPGGSSSGSGAALAAGLVPLALGTDTGGSVRNPAGHCGITAIKPTYGLVSRRGTFPLAFTLDHVGPMARTVEDLALMLDVMAGHDPLDPGSARERPGNFMADIGRGVHGLRIGVVRHFHEQDMPAAAEVIDTMNCAATTLAAEGAVITDIRLPTLADFAAAQRIIFHTEAWAIHSQRFVARPQDYTRTARCKLMPGAFLFADDYVWAQQRRAQLIEEVDRVLQQVDLLLVANSFEPACEIADEQEFARTYGRHARAPFNLTGHPALAVMSGLSAKGLPLSVQLVGRHFDEPTVLRAGAAYEQAAGWNQRHPALD